LKTGYICLRLTLQIILKSESIQEPFQFYLPNRSFFAGNSAIFGRFSYREMKKATRNFSTVLGGGENSTVFRGQLADGSVVAIRRVDSSPKQSQQEFCKEMEFLGRLHHRHLVGLRGFCLTRFERSISATLKFRYPPIYGSYSAL